MHVEAHAKPQAPKAEQSHGHALKFFSSGLEGLLVDKKDQELLKALRLIDERMAELPLETGQPVPVAPIQFIWQLFTGPMTLRAGIQDGERARNEPPFYAMLDFYTDTDKRAEGLLQKFTGMINSFGRMPIQPAPNVPSMKMVDLQGTPLYFGVTKNGKPALSLGLNNAPQAPFEFGKSNLPQGVEPALKFELDARELQGLFEMMKEEAQNDEELAPALMQFEMMGLVGPNATTITSELGYATDRAHAATRFARYRQLMDQSGLLSEQRLTANDLRRVPADTTYARLSKFNIAGIGESLRRFAEQAGNDPEQDIMGMVEMHTGINPQRDLLDHLGETAGMYMSDSTGGGGLLSLAAFVEVKNAEGLQQTMNKLASMANQLGTQHAKGYVRVSERTVNEVPMTVLSFPGLPVPLELSWTIADGYLYGALTPGSLLAALQQGKAGAKSLADNPRFQEMGGGKIDNAIQVTFVDTPRMIRDGYGVLNLAMSAISNGVRSPSDAQRGVGVILPSLNDLSNGAKAAVSVVSMEGDDMVARMQLDRSLLVNLAGGFGIIGGSSGTIATTALMTGLLLPALTKARESAKEAKSAAQLRGISMAMMTYAAENDDRMPASMEDLLQAGYLTDDMLQSPVGPAPEGDDYWISIGGQNDSDAERVLGYDRAMFAHGDKVAVVFFDGHVEIMDVFEFEELLEREPNAGKDFDLP
jgi:prepilin-type processing-associated H-X9-DG protein